MADYNKAIPITLEFEGGLSDDAADSGGITKYGVCIEFAKDTHDLKLFDKTGNGRITREDIKRLTIEDAKKAFKKYFWDKLSLDDCPSDKKALLLFDFSMNSGIGNAVPALQRTLNKMGSNLVIDGKYGPKTRAAFFAADEKEFCEKYLNTRENFFRRIVERRPSQRVFLRGWLNRVNSLRKIIKTYPD